MVKKLCPKCREYSYSSSTEGKWVCPTCGLDLTKRPVLQLDRQDCDGPSRPKLTLIRANAWD